jgi:hypothetical protein
MDAITVHSDVIDGQIRSEARLHIARCLKHFDGKRVTIVIRRFVKTRSSKQNRFMHGPFFKALQTMFHEAGSELTTEQTKEFFKNKFGVRELITAPDGTTHEILKSTAKYGTIECEECMEKARAWAAGYGQALPFPNEQMWGDV